MEKNEYRGQELLAAKKIRKTRARMAVVKSLLEAGSPVSVPGLMRMLEKSGERFNKTTLYRELEFLIAHDIASKAIIFASCQYYEIVQEHHHHMICTDCGDIQDVAAKEDICFMNREFFRKRGFRIIDHSLEFFGVCRSCAVKY